MARPSDRVEFNGASAAESSFQAQELSEQAFPTKLRSSVILWNSSGKGVPPSHKDRSQMLGVCRLMLSSVKSNRSSADLPSQTVCNGTTRRTPKCGWGNSPQSSRAPSGGKTTRTSSHPCTGWNTQEGVPGGLASHGNCALGSERCCPPTRNPLTRIASGQCSAVLNDVTPIHARMLPAPADRRWPNMTERGLGIASHLRSVRGVKIRRVATPF